MAANGKSLIQSSLWSSGAALLLATALVSSAPDNVRTYQQGGLAMDYSGALAGGHYADRVPDWFKLPDLSSRPAVSAFGAISPAGSRVSYRTISSVSGVISHHKSDLAWKGFDWLTFPDRPGQPVLAIGLVPSSGERMVITVRNDGPVRSVDVLYTAPTPG